jgi:hypothetical protein
LRRKQKETVSYFYYKKSSGRTARPIERAEALPCGACVGLIAAVVVVVAFWPLFKSHNNANSSAAVFCVHLEAN